MHSSKKLATTAENLDRVARQALRNGLADETTNMTDALRLLSRVCAGQGRPVPLPQLQQGPNGRNFISDPQARFHELNKHWGFDIVCVTTWKEGQKHSTRHIVLAGNGLPTIDRTAPRRSGIHQTLTPTGDKVPKSAPLSTGPNGHIEEQTLLQIRRNPPLATNGANAPTLRQYGLTPNGVDSARTARTFTQWEMGRAR